MFAAQLVGMFAGCFLSPATFQMFVAGQPDLGQPGSTYPAPFAQVYRNMAVVGVGGASELGQYCLWVSNSASLFTACCGLVRPRLAQDHSLPVVRVCGGGRFTGCTV